MFDLITGRWERVASPIEVREMLMHASSVVDDKVYTMADLRSFALLYDWVPKIQVQMNGEHLVHLNVLDLYHNALFGVISFCIILT